MFQLFFKFKYVWRWFSSYVTDRPNPVSLNNTSLATNNLGRINDDTSLRTERSICLIKKLKRWLFFQKLKNPKVNVRSQRDKTSAYCIETKLGYRTQMDELHTKIVHITFSFCITFVYCLKSALSPCSIFVAYATLLTALLFSEAISQYMILDALV